MLKDRPGNSMPGRSVIAGSIMKIALEAPDEAGS